MRSWARRWPLPAGAAVVLCLTVTAAGRLSFGQQSGQPHGQQASSETADQALAAAMQRAQLRAQAQAASQNGITQTGLEPGGGLRSAEKAVTVASLSAAAPAIAPLRRLRPADLLVVAPTGLPGRLNARIAGLPGVAAAEQIDAARISLGGKQVAMLGVHPSSFRAFAAGPTARATKLWQDVAAGGVAVSYTMGRQDRLPVGQAVRVAGARTERLRVAGYGTVGIAGIDAVVSDRVARSLGIPAGNAIVISAPHADLSSLMHAVRRLLPRQAVVAPLVAQTRPAESASPESPASPLPAGQGVTGPGAAGAPGVTAADGPGLSSAQVAAFVSAAESRRGRPYVWGGSGPEVFDCSGLVQWSLARAGIVMPRVAVDQARTGPQVAVSQLQPGDLLFYHTDPTAPQYISHVAIYLGGGRMIQAPEPGEDVEIVPAVTSGPGFAGAVQVYPRLAAAVAASLPS